jgi:thiol-disulfide isomerase/thioredoxin
MIRRAMGLTAAGVALAVGLSWEMNVGTKLSASSAPALSDEGLMPELVASAAGTEENLWLNSVPLSRASLRGKVVLVDFWTYSCINSLRNLPYVASWAAKYKDAGLIVIGVHTPEFGFEKERANVEMAVRDYDVTYPVAIDSNYRIWKAFENEYWPADYFIDGKGRIRYHHFGEGDYANSERVIQELLKENGEAGVSTALVRTPATGVEAPAGNDERSPETYLGYRRAENFGPPERLAHDSPAVYNTPASLGLNNWGLSGGWNVGPESAVLQAAPGSVTFRFHSRDLHMVLGPAQNGTPVRFKITLDGAAPGSDCGVDCSPAGNGEVRKPRLYQLVRQNGTIRDKTFRIEFLDPGVRAYVFTFG